MSLIGFHAVIANLEYHLFSVGSSFRRTDASHSPQSLGSHKVALELDIAFTYVHVVLCFDAASGGEHSYRHGNV